MKRDKLENWLEYLNGVITAKDFRENNIPAVYLKRLEEKGYIKRVERGVYIRSNSDYDINYFTQYRYKKGVLSYESALYLQGYLDYIPDNVTMTVYTGYKFNKKNKNLKVNYVKKDLYKLGVTAVKTDFDNMVIVYDIERCICDMVLNKHKISLSTYSKVFKKYVESETKDYDKLYEYAVKLGIEKKMRDILEVIHMF